MESHQLKESIKLSFAAKDIPSMDTFSASDPMVVLSSFTRNDWMRVGRTEAINNNNNPVFATQLPVNYYFEEEQRFRVDMYDVDTANYDALHEHDYIGFAEFTLSRLMTAPGCQLRLLLSKKDGTKRSKASIIIRGDEVKESREVAMVNISAKDLFKQGIFSKDTTVLQFHRIRDDGTLFLAHSTAPVVKTQDPSYPPFSVPVGLLTSLNPEAEIILRVCRVNGSKFDITGQVKVKFSELILQDPVASGDRAQNEAPKAEKVFILQKADSKTGASIANTQRGRLIVNRFHIYRPLSFLDFVAGGLDMRLILAVDFTASNQDPRSPSSLHYRHPQGHLNPYERAILSVGGVLTSYTNKSHFPVFGFGGLPKGQSVSHCFPLAPEHTSVAHIPGIDGVMAQYRYALQNTTLSGPTFFAELINTACAMAMEPFRPDHQHYTTLLIITDGMINDMALTVDAVIRASDKPLSIVIVGVGNADFTNMNTLDGDDHRLQSRTAGVAQRDIVQFVPMREVEHEGANAIASHTLAEIPEQVISFMNMHGIRPIPPRTADPDRFYGEAPDINRQNSGVPYTPTPN